MSPCCACKTNECAPAQALCDECAAQLDAELDKRAIGSWGDLTRACERSVPESYRNYMTLETPARRDTGNVQEYAEALGQLLLDDPIIYYARLRMIDARARMAAARFAVQFAGASCARADRDPAPLTEPPRISEMRQVQTPAEESLEHDIPAGYPPNWNELRRLVYRRDNYTCQDGGETNIRVVAHHILPLWDGGSNELNNLVTLCEQCHENRHILISAERRTARRALRRGEFRWDAETIVAVIVGLLVAAWLIAYLLVR